MEVIVCPGAEKLYAVALVEMDGSFVRLSEHNTPDEAITARNAANLAAEDAVMAMRRVFA